MRRTLVATAVSAFAMTGIALAASASAAPKTDPGFAGPFHAACGTAGPNIENRVEADAPASGAANQRSGSSTGCGIPGVLQPTDDALYFCYTMGNDGYTWTYLRNQRTGVRGWVRDDLLDLNEDGRNRGSIWWCGF
jgi:hypothetical protein